MSIWKELAEHIGEQGGTLENFPFPDGYIPIYDCTLCNIVKYMARKDGHYTDNICHSWCPVASHDTGIPPVCGCISVRDNTQSKEDRAKLARHLLKVVDNWEDVAEIRTHAHTYIKGV